MAFTNSPGIVTNGLVLGHDMNNVKSFVGPPISNSLAYTYPTPVGTGTAAGYSSVSGSEIVNIPSLGPVTTYYNLIQNNYSAVSTNCCPSLFQYGSMAVTGSTLYTYGIVYKCDSGYTGANFMYRYEYNGATYVTEAGVFNSASQVALGDGWFYMLATFTTQPTTTLLNSTGLWYYQYSTFTDKISVAKIMITPGNYTGLHPKYWPAMNTTRTTAQAIKDLTNNNTLTATSLTYASNGNFSFNGSANYIDCGTGGALTLGNNGPFTVSAWINIATLKNFSGIISKVQSDRGGVYSFMCTAHNDGTLAFYNNAAWYYSTNAGITTNTWYNVVFSFTGSVMSYYVNGVAYGTSSCTWPETTAHKVFIGSWYSPNTAYDFNGTISAAQLYNRALPATEITQNFNALRGRYGV